MFCSKCGTQITDTASFCSKCGQPVHATPTTPPLVNAKVGVPKLTQALAILMIFGGISQLFSFVMLLATANETPTHSFAPRIEHGTFFQTVLVLTFIFGISKIIVGFLLRKSQLRAYWAAIGLYGAQLFIYIFAPSLMIIQEMNERMGGMDMASIQAITTFIFLILIVISYRNFHQSSSYQSSSYQSSSYQSSSQRTSGNTESALDRLERNRKKGSAGTTKCSACGKVYNGDVSGQICACGSRLK